MEVAQYTESHPSRQVCKIWDKLHVTRDSLIMYKKRRIMVPEHARVNLMRVAHRRHDILAKYYWEDIEEDVSRMLKACKTCSKGYSIEDVD